MLPLVVVFFSWCRWDFRQSIPASFPLCLSTPLELLAHNTSNDAEEDSFTVFIYQPTFRANFIKKNKKKNTQDNHWLTTLCRSLGEAHGLKDYHVLGWRQEGQDVSWLPLWYTSKLWAADKFGSTPPQQLPSWFCVLLDKLKACGGDSLARHPTAVPFSVSHKIPWIQAWQIPAGARRSRFDSGDQNLIGFPARANSQAANLGFLLCPLSRD